MNSIFELLAYSDNTIALNAISKEAIADYLKFNDDEFNEDLHDKYKYMYISKMITDDADKLYSDKNTSKVISIIFRCLSNIIYHYIGEDAKEQLHTIECEDRTIINASYALDRIAIFRGLCIISKGLNIYPQYVDPFGPMMNIMTNFGLADGFEYLGIHSTANKIMEYKNIYTDKYINVFETRFGYHINQAVECVYNILTNKNDSVARKQAIKLAIYTHINMTIVK